MGNIYIISSKKNEKKTLNRSIYELECIRLQPTLLKMESKLSLEETIELIKKIKKTFSLNYVKVYELVKSLTFEINEKKNSKTFEEIIQSLKLKKLNDFELDVAFDAISDVYDVTYEEAKAFYE